MTQKYDRFKAAPWFQENVKPPVLIGGAGGIGSWLTLLLSRAGFETHVYDFDTLEAVNMAGQLFMHTSIGKPKVYALEDLVSLLCQETIITYNEKVTENTMTNDIVFTAFDNMKARKDMFTTWAQNFRGNRKAIFIDGRLTAEQLTIFCIKGDDEAAFEEYQREHLFDDSVVAELPCTFKQTSHGAAMIAAHMVEQFTNWYASAVLDRDLSRTAEFFWEYFIPISYHSSRNHFEWENRPEESPVITEVIDTPKVLTTEEAKSRANEMLTKFGTPLVNKFMEGELSEDQLRSLYRPTAIPEGHVMLDSGEILPINDANISESSSVTVTHNMTSEEIKDKFGVDVPNSTVNIPFPMEELLGETEETDLTPEEIAEMDDYINERTEMNEQDRREAATLIAEGLTSQAQENSLSFEEEDIPRVTDVPPTTSLDDLPF